MELYNLLCDWLWELKENKNLKGFFQKVYKRHVVRHLTSKYDSCMVKMYKRGPLMMNLEVRPFTKLVIFTNTIDLVESCKRACTHTHPGGASRNEKSLCPRPITTSFNGGSCKTLLESPRQRVSPCREIKERLMYGINPHDF